MSALDYQNHPGNPDHDPSKDLQWTPIKHGKDVTILDLREMMITALLKDGWTDREIIGYVTAMESHGLLRRNCPGWMRNSAALHYLIPEGNGHQPKDPFVRYPLTDAKIPNR